MSDYRTVIFVGPQGSGKGTQLERLKSVFLSQSSPEEVLVFQSGSLFRNFATENSYAARKVADTINTGKLQPLFLSVGLWSREFVTYMRPDAHVLIDGFPRTVEEAKVLETAWAFYGRDRIDVVNLEVPEEEVRKRMLERARADDTPDAIEERLRWYREEIASMQTYLTENPRYVCHTISGLEDIETVHALITSLFA